MYLATKNDLQSVSKDSTVQFINKASLFLNGFGFIGINLSAFSNPESIEDPEKKQEAVTSRNKSLNTLSLLSWAA